MIIDDKDYDIGFDYGLMCLFGYFCNDVVFGDRFEVVGIDSDEWMIVYVVFIVVVIVC